MEIRGLVWNHSVEWITDLDRLPSFVGRKREKAWNIAPLCLFWIWRERNRRALIPLNACTKPLLIFSCFFFEIGLSCMLLKGFSQW